MVLIVTLGLLMAACMALYAKYYFNYLLRGEKNRLVILALMLGYLAVILLAIGLSGFIYDLPFFEPHDTHTGRLLFVLLWLVPFGITTVIGAVRVSRALPSDHSTLEQNPFWSWFLRLDRSPPTRDVQMTRQDFLVRYRKQKADFWRFTVGLVVAGVLINIPIVAAFVAQMRGRSPDLFTMVWYLGFTFSVFAFFVFRSRALTKYDFSCRNCRKSLVMDEGKTVLSTGKCPACGSLVVEVSDE